MGCFYSFIAIDIIDYISDDKIEMKEMIDIFFVFFLEMQKNIPNFVTFIAGIFAPHDY